jgi:hypothetical protein
MLSMLAESLQRYLKKEPVRQRQPPGHHVMCMHSRSPMKIISAKK